MLQRKYYVLLMICFSHLYFIPILNGQADLTMDLWMNDGIWCERGTRTPYTGLYNEYSYPDLKGARYLVSAGSINQGYMNGTRTDFYKDGSVQMKGEIKWGRKVGEWSYYLVDGTEYRGYLYDGYDSKWTPPAAGTCLYLRNGDLDEVWHYQDSVRHGAYVKFFELNPGLIKEESTYNAGVRNGPLKRYYKSGTVSYIQFFNSGKLDSVYTAWYESGDLKTSGQYKNGFKSGLWTGYHQDGSLESKGEYVDGCKSGEWSVYYSNGQLKSKGKYKPVGDHFSTETGRWVRYTEDGTPIR